MRPSSLRGGRLRVSRFTHRAFIDPDSPLFTSDSVQSTGLTCRPDQGDPTCTWRRVWWQVGSLGHELAAAKLAMVMGRPVKILLNREETFYTHRGRHPMEMSMTLAARQDGRLTALDSQIMIDGGAYTSFDETTYYAGQLLTAPTGYETYRFDSSRVFTNNRHVALNVAMAQFNLGLVLKSNWTKWLSIFNSIPSNLGALMTWALMWRRSMGRVTSNDFACLERRSSERLETTTRENAIRSGSSVAGSTYISGTAYQFIPMICLSRVYKLDWTEVVGHT